MAFLAALPGILSAAGSLFGGMAGGRAEGRQHEILNTQAQNQLQQRLFEAILNSTLQQEGYGLQRSRLGADRAEFERDSPNVRFQQALRGGLAQNLQDVGVNAPSRIPVTQFSGGLRPSAMGSTAREAGGRMADIGLENMGQDTFDIADAPTLPSAPQFQGLPQASGFDKFLQFAGPGLGLAGLLGGGMGWGQQTPNTASTGSVVNPDLLRPGAGGFGQSFPDYNAASQARAAKSRAQRAMGQFGFDPNDPLGYGRPR